MSSLASKVISKIDSSLHKREERKKLIRDYTTDWLAGTLSIPAAEIKGVDKNPDGKTCNVNLRSFYGNYVVDETTWRVLGMIPGSFCPMEHTTMTKSMMGKSAMKTVSKDAAGGLMTKEPTPLTVEYSVLQLPQTIQVGDKKVEETLTKSRNEHILRVCFSDNDTVLGEFRKERELLKIMRKKYCHNRRFYDRFPRVLAEGELGKLKGIISRSEETNWIYQPKIPKPFYVCEKIGPTLEDFRQCQRIPDTITPHCSVFLVIGCITTLRLVHEAGIAVCDVRPSHFSIRLGPTGKLHRRESDVIGRMVLTQFGRARAYRTLPFKRQTSWAGSRKYISPAVMHHEPPGPVDDVLSCIYMFYEFLTGELPWAHKEKGGLIKVVTDEAVVAAKEALEKMGEVEDKNDKGGKNDKKPPALFLHLSQVFKAIRKANGYDKPVDYEEVNRLLLNGVLHREDIDRGRSTFSFHHPSMFTYRHGVEEKEVKGTLFSEKAKTGETKEIRQKADWLFSYAKDKRREEDTAQK